MFRAYDPERERLVAIKVFGLDLAPERVHRLVAELEQVVDAQLAHPNIATPLAAGIVEASAFLAQEYLAADSLDTVLRERGPFRPAAALAVAEQLARALTAAAAARIDHGGLHPRDVLMVGDQPKVTGLGVVRALERVGAAGPVRRPYTAPERMAGGAWTSRADVFSLAALVCELLWGRRIAGVGASAVDALGDLPGLDRDALGAVLARALDEQPEARFESTQAFVELLGPVVARQSSVERQQSEPPETADVPEPGPASGAATPVAPAPRTAGAGSPGPGGAAAARTVPGPWRPAPEDLPLRRLARRPTPRVIPPAECRPGAEAEPQLPLGDGPGVGETPLRREPERPSPRRESVVDAAPVPAPLVPMPDVPQPSNWPLAASLAVGLAVGFASGYGVGMRGHPATMAQATPPPVQAATAEVANPVPLPAAPAPASTGAAPGLAAPAVERRHEPPSLDAPLHAESPAAAVSPAPVLKPAPKPEPLAAGGTLRVRSAPAGALVIVDGVEQGRTPLTVRDLKNGPHRVRVTRDGYASEDRRIMVTTVQPSPTIDVRLVPERASGAPRRRAAAPEPKAAGSGALLAVVSRPSGASVYVDGRLVGTTPMTIPSIAVGEHAVRLESPGYRPWSSSISVKSGIENKVTASLGN